jgi:hypothetical protein
MVHMFLVNDQRDSQIHFYVFIYIFNSLYVSSSSRSSSGETNCINTTSGSYQWSCRVRVGSLLPTCTRHDHRQLPEVVLTQFVSPDDVHDVLETFRKLKRKINTQKGICASRWSFTKNMHFVCLYCIIILQCTMQKHNNLYL